MLYIFGIRTRKRKSIKPLIQQTSAWIDFLEVNLDVARNQYTNLTYNWSLNQDIAKMNDDINKREV